MDTGVEYRLRIRFIWRLFGLLLAIVPVWLVWQGIKDQNFDLLTWIALAILPLAILGGVFIPATLRTTVSEDGISAEWYVGIGRFRLGQTKFELDWCEVFSVHEGFPTLLPGLSPKVIFFAGLHEGEEQRIFISSIQSSYKKPLSYALRKVSPHVLSARIRETVEETDYSEASEP